MAGIRNLVFPDAVGPGESDRSHPGLPYAAATKPPDDKDCPVPLMPDETPRLALGTFRTAPGAPAFPGLLVAGRVLDLCALAPTTRDLLERWDAVRPRLDELAQSPDDAPQHPLDTLEVLAPVEPRQVIQAGANYRTHVVDLAVKHTEIRPGQTVEDVRAEVAAKLWGPGRHLAGNNTFSYFLDPQGNTVEYTTELETVDEDTWHPSTYDFTDPGVSDQWGTANAMNEFVARKSFNDPDKGLFVAPPV